MFRLAVLELVVLKVQIVAHDAIATTRQRAGVGATIGVAVVAIVACLAVGFEAIHFAGRTGQAGALITKGTALAVAADLTGWPSINGCDLVGASHADEAQHKHPTMHAEPTQGLYSFAEQAPTRSFTTQQR